MIGEFVEVAAMRRRNSRPDRPQRLALPLIGTGHGGLSGAKGDIIKPLLTELSKFAHDRHVDFVLCTDDMLAWSAVQSVRDKDDYWALSDDEEALAVLLAKEARAERLVTWAV